MKLIAEATTVSDNESTVVRALVYHLSASTIATIARLGAMAQEHNLSEVRKFAYPTRACPPG